LLFEEKKEGKRILHGKKGKDRRFPELPDIRVEGLYAETRTVSSTDTISMVIRACHSEIYLLHAVATTWPRDTRKQITVCSE
jgi:hypothetical protein